MNGTHVAQLFMVLGVLIVLLALTPLAGGASLQDMVNSLRGFWVIVGAGIFLVGALSPRYK